MQTVAVSTIDHGRGRNLRGTPTIPPLRLKISRSTIPPTARSTIRKPGGSENPSDISAKNPSVSATFTLRNRWFGKQLFSVHDEVRM